jgi:hypothetical protein
MNKDRRARQKARRTSGHAHLEGTRCTICQPLPESALAGDPLYIPPPQAPPLGGPAVVIRGRQNGKTVSGIRGKLGTLRRSG